MILAYLALLAPAILNAIYADCPDGILGWTVVAGCALILICDESIKLLTSFRNKQ